jgi:hypothetical protein
MSELNMSLFPQYQDPTTAQAKAFNYAEQVRQAAANRQAGQQYASGDYSGASQTLARSGDVGGAQKLRTEGQQTNQAGLEYVAKALPVFEAVQKAHATDADGGRAALGAAFDQIAPEAQAATGASAQALATWRASLVADPQGTITRTRAQLPIKYQESNGGLYGIQGMQATLLRDQNGNPIQEPKFQTIAPGATLAPTNQAGAGMIQQLNGQQQPQTQIAPGQPQQGAPPTPSSDQVAAAITKYIPGSIITSTGRTPEHNAEVGGVPDSMHLNAQAVDFVMPKGVTFDQVKALVQQSGLPVTELLNEGSHVHIGWGPKGGQAPQQTAQAAPSNVYRAPPQFREPTAAELKAHPGADQVNTSTGEMHYKPIGYAAYQPLSQADEPNIASWRAAVLNGNATMVQVPAIYRTAVANSLAGDPKGAYSPQAATRLTLASERITAPFKKLPQYDLTANGLPYLQRIDAAFKTPGSVSDQDLLDSLTKLNTAGNAVTEAQVGLILKGQSFSDWANTIKNKFKNGGVLSDNQRQQIKEIANSIYANYRKGYQPVYDRAVAQLRAAGIPEAFWTIPDLNTINAGQSQVGGNAPAPDAKTSALLKKYGL